MFHWVISPEVLTLHKHDFLPCKVALMMCCCCFLQVWRCWRSQWGTWVDWSSEGRKARRASPGGSNRHYQILCSCARNWHAIVCLWANYVPHEPAAVGLGTERTESDVALWVVAVFSFFFPWCKPRQRCALNIHCQTQDDICHAAQKRRKIK